MKRPINFKKLLTFDRKPEPKKLRNECDTCINDYAEKDLLSACIHCGKNHKNWKPRPEPEIIIEIEHDYHGDINILNITDFNKAMWKLIPRPISSKDKGQSAKFKLIKIGR